MSTTLDGLGTLLDRELARWPAAAGVAVVDDSGVLAARGEDRAHPWASVTKLLAALTVLDLADQSLLDLDEPAGPPGSTVRHLLAHASGLSRDTDKLMAPPGRRRIYSNRGVEVLAEHVEQRRSTAFATLVQERVLEPLGMRATTLDGSPAHGARGPVGDLALLAAHLLRPQPGAVASGLLAEATTTAFPGLDGLLPGFGPQRPNDWGLGFELRGTKSPHWTAPGNAPTTFGHFGQSGSFLWVDPSLGLACVSAGATPFGPWAVEAWPRLSAMVLAEARGVPDPDSPNPEVDRR